MCVCSSNETIHGFRSHGNISQIIADKTIDHSMSRPSKFAQARPADHWYKGHVYEEAAAEFGSETGIEIIAGENHPGRGPSGG